MCYISFHLALWIYEFMYNSYAQLTVIMVVLLVLMLLFRPFIITALSVATTSAFKKTIFLFVFENKSLEFFYFFWFYFFNFNLAHFSSFCWPLCKYLWRMACKTFTSTYTTIYTTTYAMSLLLLILSLLLHFVFKCLSQG